MTLTVFMAVVVIFMNMLNHVVLYTVTSSCGDRMVKGKGCTLTCYGAPGVTEIVWHIKDVKVNVQTKTCNKTPPEFKGYELSCALIFNGYDFLIKIPSVEYDMDAADWKCETPSDGKENDAMVRLTADNVSPANGELTVRPQTIDNGGTVALTCTPTPCSPDVKMALLSVGGVKQTLTKESATKIGALFKNVYTASLAVNNTVMNTTSDGKVKATCVVFWEGSPVPVASALITIRSQSTSGSAAVLLDLPLTILLLITSILPLGNCLLYNVSRMLNLRR